MLKQKLNSLISSRVFCIIIAVVLAVLIWLYVVDKENPNVSATISGIDVEFIGEDDILADRQLMIIDGAEQTISLKLMGKRSDIAKLDKANIGVTVDLKDVRISGVTEKVYTITFPKGVNPDDVYILEKNPETVILNIGQIVTKRIPVTGTYDGGTKEGYMAEPMEYSPEYITISGPEEIITTVSYAKVELERENVSKTIKTEVEFTLMNYNDQPVVSDEIIADTDTVSITLPVLTVKEVPITVEYTPGGGVAKEDVVQTLSVDSVTLAGDAALLDGLNQLSVGPIDLASFVSSTTVDLPIPIPNDVTNLTGVSTVNVKVEIRGFEARKMSATNIVLRNVSEGYEAKPITQSLDVTVRAPAEVINLISSTNIQIASDLSDIGNATGTYTVNAIVSVLGYGDAGVVGDYKVVVSIEEEPEEEPEEPGEEGENDAPASQNR